MKFVTDCIIATRYITSKVATMEDGLVQWMLEKQYYYGSVFFGQVDLVYDSILFLGLSL